jgi:hypothetical protein
VINTVKTGDYTSALNLLQNDLIKKNDGCALSAQQPERGRLDRNQRVQVRPIWS